MEQKVYLVGKVWFVGQGDDWPNCGEAPDFCFGTMEEAEEEYKKLAKEDESNEGRFQEAYLVEVKPGSIRVIKGRDRI